MFAAYVSYLIAFAGVIAFVGALPLNINLGAYSPALVVGDGEISFSGKADVNSLMTALEGAAVNTANTVAQSENAPGQAPENENLEKQDAREISTILGGQRKEIEPRLESLESPEAEAEDDEGEEEVEVVAVPEKRDIQGFDRALRYAEAALVKGPKVQLGTGAEGSGVGIIVDNNQEAARRPGRGTEGGEAARPEAPPPPPAVVPPPGGQVPVPVPEGGAAKRGLDSQQPSMQRRAKVTTMYVRSGIPAALNGASSANIVSREVRKVTQDVSKRDDSNPGFDSVNLNVPAEGVTMTFVETDDDNDEE